jgi:hypothetical protein
VFWKNELILAFVFKEGVWRGGVSEISEALNESMKGRKGKCKKRIEGMNETNEVINESMKGRKKGEMKAMKWRHECNRWNKWSN